MKHNVHTCWCYLRGVGAHKLTAYMIPFGVSVAVLAPTADQRNPIPLIQSQDLLPSQSAERE